jgi:hypothetical protein
MLTMENSEHFQIFLLDSIDPPNYFFSSCNLDAPNAAIKGRKFTLAGRSLTPYSKLISIGRFSHLKPENKG